MLFFRSVLDPVPTAVQDIDDHVFAIRARVIVQQLTAMKHLHRGELLLRERPLVLFIQNHRAPWRLAVARLPPPRSPGASTQPPIGRKGLYTLQVPRRTQGCSEPEPPP